MLFWSTNSYAQPRVDSTNAFAWDAPSNTQFINNYEVNIDFTETWTSVGTNTQYPVPATLSPQFHTFYVRACGPTHSCSDPLSVGFVFVVVSPGTPGMPTNLRIIILASPASISAQPTPTNLPKDKPVK